MHQLSRYTEVCRLEIVIFSYRATSSGAAGLYDYGPPGSSLQANIVAEWRRHFIIEEHMLELDTTIMTPAPVFETSGHVARFADWMVKDKQTGDVLRADHLVKNVLESRLAGDKEARGVAIRPSADDKKKKKNVKSTSVKLEDEVVKEYEIVLAQVRSLQALLSTLQCLQGLGLCHSKANGSPSFTKPKVNPIAMFLHT